MRIIILGATGMLGKDFIAFYSKLPGYEVYAISRNTEHILPYSNINIIHIDVTDQISFSECLKTVQPDIIIHSAALTNIDACEEHKEYALWLHSEIIKIVGIETPDAKLVYISTDSVFDGKDGDYSENDTPKPVNYYATTKRLGELNAVKLKNHLVIRTNIYGYHMFDQPSLSEWALTNLEKGKGFTGFSDVYFNPLYTGQLTSIVHRLLDLKYIGIINVGSDIYISKYDFLKKVAIEFGYDAGLIEGKPFDATLFKAPRSNNTTLNTNHLQSITDSVPKLSEGLALFKSEYTTIK